METPSAQPGSAAVDQSAAPKESPALAILRKLTKMAEAGEIVQVVTAYATVNGAATVLSSPMSAISMNHFCRLIDRRVAREYDAALTKANQNVSPTQPMRSNSPKSPIAQLPRNVRRRVKAEQQRLQKKAEKKASKPNGADTIRRTPG